MSHPASSSSDERLSSIRRAYGTAALRVVGAPEALAPDADQTVASCCCGGKANPVTSELYTALQTDELPEAAVLASLGCGNPTALAALNPGEVVLDLGSGGGIDVLLSARRVGPTGFAYGLDMTDEMLALANRNREDAGMANVEFMIGQIEAIPLPDATVDVIISNCVINLSSDKDQVLREAFRVLRPGGRLAVSDVVVEGELPESLRSNLQMLVGCVAGALSIEDYRQKLEAAGFVDASVEATRQYRFDQLESAWAPKGVDRMTEDERRAVDGRIFGAFIRATKPAEAAQ